MKVGVNEIKLEKEDIAEVSKALNDGWYSSTGPYVEKFETDWSTYCSSKYAVSVSNGTMALVRFRISCPLMSLMSLAPDWGSAEPPHPSIYVLVVFATCVFVVGWFVSCGGERLQVRT